MHKFPCQTPHNTRSFELDQVLSINVEAKKLLRRVSINQEKTNMKTKN